MKTRKMLAIALIATALVLAVAALAKGAETEPVLPVPEELPDSVIFAGMKSWIFRIDGPTVCREVVAGRCIPIVSEEGTPGVLVKDGKKFLVLLPRIGDF